VNFAEIAVALVDLSDWLSEWTETGSIWYLKRLAANDTLANKSHQVGPYIPKELLFEAFPRLGDSDRKNPDVIVEAFIDSHADHRQVRAVWYNNALLETDGTRNEARITRWGGGSSALLDPDSTGALTVFIFRPPGPDGARELRIWVCGHATEEDLIEERISPVEPGQHVVWRPNVADVERVIEISKGRLPTCRLSRDQLPPGWLTVFPAAIEIVRKVRELRPLPQERPDVRLVRRRECEFELFQSVEEAIESQNINRGFPSVADFLTHAQRLLQRRKARSGKSLELQTRELLLEEGFIAGQDFSHNPESDPGKRPDFLFPSEVAYKNATFPATRLRMLAAKTTCKDRWRQILNEADRIPRKHLLTLQEGVSENQYAEMKAAGVQLVIPLPLVERFPQSIRPELMTLEKFIESVRHLAVLG
jgi:hypothetical protein